MNKCEIFALHNDPPHTISNIKAKSGVKYLGMTVTKNKEISERENIYKYTMI